MCAASNPNKLGMCVPDVRRGRPEAKILPNLTVAPPASIGPGAEARRAKDALINDRRMNPRLPLQLPLEVCRTNGQGVRVLGASLVSRDISTMGVYFVSPERLERGAQVELDVALVDRPLDRGRVRLKTRGEVVRVEPDGAEGNHGLAVRFDEISFHYEDAEFRTH